MKIIRFIRTVNPAYGGPIEGLKKVSETLERMGHTTEVACLDSPEDPWTKDFPFKVYALGPSKFKYGYSKKLVDWVINNAVNYDAAIIHGIWQYQSFGAWRGLRKIQKPYFVYTHGMLDPWFKKQYPLKHIKKWLYWPWADYRVIHNARRVLFTSEEEKIKARSSFWLYKCNEAVVPYGTLPPDNERNHYIHQFTDAFPHLSDKKVFLFLGRIHEKKGCDILIRAFSKVAHLHDKLHLVIAGPDQSGWRLELQRLCETLDITHRVTWTDMLTGDLKWGAYYHADAFVLPSHQENFGISVAEALACGTPVLISDKVNIWREVQNDNSGIVSTDDLEGTIKNLTQWLSLSTKDQDVIRNNAVATFDSRFNLEKSADSLLRILRCDE